MNCGQLNAKVMQGG